MQPKTIVVASAAVLMSCITIAWYMAPELAVRFITTCPVQSVLVYSAANGHVVTQSHWTIDGTTSLRTASYSADVSFYNNNNQLIKRIFLEKSLVLEAKNQGHYYIVSTNQAHPKGAGDVEADKWTEPFTRKGFSAGVYLMRTSGGTILTGFQERPRGICITQ